MDTSSQDIRGGLGGKDLWTDPAESLDKLRAEGGRASEWLVETLNAVRARIEEQAPVFAEQWKVDPDAVAVYLAHQVVIQLRTLRDEFAGEGEAAGKTVALMGSGIGQLNVANVRRSMPLMKTFRDARRQANATGETAHVDTANGLEVKVGPRYNR